MMKWGWTSCRKTGWVTPDGSKWYLANFRTTQNAATNGHTIVKEVCFAAHKPTAALRTICNSGKDPMTFDGTIIN